MKKIFFILLCLKLHAQQCKVIYSVVPTLGTLKSSITLKADDSKFLKEMFAGSDEALKTMFYALVINDTKSSFEIDESKIKLKNKFALISATDDKFYMVQDSSYQLKNNSISKNLAIVLEPRTNWIYYNESKIIGTYKCLKAQIELPWTYGTAMNNGMPTYFVTAWYCPKIPIKHGPKGFGDLPGLILELQDNRVTFQATSIEFDNVPQISKNYLKDFKFLSEKKYLENIREMAKAMKYTK